MYYGNYSDVTPEYLPNYANLDAAQRDKLQDYRGREEQLKLKQHQAFQHQQNQNHNMLQMQHRLEAMNSNLAYKSHVGRVPHNQNPMSKSASQLRQSLPHAQLATSEHPPLIELSGLGWGGIYGPADGNRRKTTEETELEN
jgi:hypothetical protein